MIYVLLGQDEFTKHEYVLNLGKQQNSFLKFVVSADDLEGFSWQGKQDLFQKPELVVVKGLFKELDNIYKTQESKNFSAGNFVIIEEKLDKRLSLSKKLLADQAVLVVQFDLPHLSKFDEWIQKRVSVSGGKISKNTATHLAKKLGRDEYKEIREGGRVVAFTEAFSLWQAENEIHKLVALAGGREITIQDVDSLVSFDPETDVFKITNSLSENRKVEAYALIENFLKNEGNADAKVGILQLSALLSEQFRSIAALQDFSERKLSDNKILSITSWKPGRLFMVKKAAANFSRVKVMDFLNKLQALDAEIKSSSLPPRILLDLILSSLLSTI